MCSIMFSVAGTYIPRKECSVEETIRATIILSNQAIKPRARKECVDREGVQRVTREEWLVKKTGAYLPGAYEEVVELVNAYVLTEKVSLNQTNRRNNNHLSEMQNAAIYMSLVITHVLYCNVPLTLRFEITCIIS